MGSLADLPAAQTNFYEIEYYPVFGTIEQQRYFSAKTSFILIMTE